MRRLIVRDGERVRRALWHEIARSSESRYDHRLHGVLLVSRGLSCNAAARLLDQSPRSVQYWIRSFQEAGMAGLRERERPGRPRRLRPGQLERLRRQVCARPGEAGYAEQRWDGRLLKRHLRSVYRVSLGLRQCQRLLRLWRSDS